MANEIEKTNKEIESLEEDLNNLKKKSTEEKEKLENDYKTKSGLIWGSVLLHYGIIKNEQNMKLWGWRFVFLWRKCQT